VGDPVEERDVPGGEAVSGELQRVLGVLLGDRRRQDPRSISRRLGEVCQIGDAVANLVRQVDVGVLAAHHRRDEGEREREDGESQEYPGQDRPAGGREQSAGAEDDPEDEPMDRPRTPVEDRVDEGVQPGSEQLRDHDENDHEHETEPGPRPPTWDRAGESGASPVKGSGNCPSPSCHDELPSAAPSESDSSGTMERRPLRAVFAVPVRRRAPLQKL
jgi:hypothetical protein